MLNKLKNKHNLIIIVVIFALLIIDQITKIIFFKQGLNIANEVVENQNNNYYIVLSRTLDRDGFFVLSFS